MPFFNGLKRDLIGSKLQHERTVHPKKKTSGISTTQNQVITSNLIPIVGFG
jgi:hypothetical protein